METCCTAPGTTETGHGNSNRNDEEGGGSQKTVLLRSNGYSASSGDIGRKHLRGETATAATAATAVTAPSTATAANANTAVATTSADAVGVLTPFRMARPKYLQDLASKPDSAVQNKFDMDFTQQIMAKVDVPPTRSRSSTPATKASSGDASDSVTVEATAAGEKGVATGPSPAYVREVADLAKVEEVSKIVASPTNPETFAFPEDGQQGATCVVNGHFFEPGQPMGTWKLGTVQEWTVGGLAFHPLHLHVNPFQVSSIGEKGMQVAKVVVGSGQQQQQQQQQQQKQQQQPVDMECDAEYGYTCVGDWLDTIMLPTADDALANAADFKAKFRFVTDTFVGHEVMHCHYLNHEDLGCMTYFDIVE